MDVSERGPLRRIASSLGEIVATTTSEEAGDVDARAFHVARPGGAHVVIGGSVTSSVVVAMLCEESGALSAMAAVRVLVLERGDLLTPERVVTLPAGARGARSVRGSTGAFAIVSASAAGLPETVDVVAVHAQPPVSEWEHATLDEVSAAYPGLISQFRPPKPRGLAAAPKRPATAGRATVLRRRKTDDPN